MKELLQFLLGIVLMIAGGVMFLKNVVVSDWGLLSSLFRIGGGVNIGGIFIVLLVIAFIALLVKPPRKPNRSGGREMRGFEAYPTLLRPFPIESHHAHRKAPAHPVPFL